MKGARLVGDTRNLLGDTTCIDYSSASIGSDPYRLYFALFFLLALLVLNLVMYKLSQLENDPDLDVNLLWAKVLVILLGFYVLWLAYESFQAGLLPFSSIEISNNFNH